MRRRSKIISMEDSVDANDTFKMALICRNESINEVMAKTINGKLKNICRSFFIYGTIYPDFL